MIDAGEFDLPQWQKTYGYIRSKLQYDETHFECEMRLRMDESPAHKEFYSAVLAARESAKTDGIRPDLGDDAILRLSARQGIQAACLGREDIATVMALQLPLLQRLDRLHLLERANLEGTTALLKVAVRNRTLLWVAIWLLVYIAIKIS